MFPQLIADLTGRPVDVPDVTTEWAALGAAVQAAAVAAGEPVAGVARRWAQARKAPRHKEPSIDAATAAEVRGAYAAAAGAR